MELATTDRTEGILNEDLLIGFKLLFLMTSLINDHNESGYKNVWHFDMHNAKGALES